MNTQHIERTLFFGGLFIFIFFALCLNAQQQNIPLTWQFSRTSENFFEEINEHTSLKPLLQSRLYLNKTDSSFNPSQIDPNVYRYQNDKSKHWFMRKTFHENLIKIDSGDFWLTIDPLLHFSNSIDYADTSGNKISNNTRGVIIRGNIGKQFSFTSSFYENQSYFPKYISEYIESKAEWYYAANTNKWFQRPGYGPVPGQGRSKPFKKYGYDYAFSQGYISFSPKAWINFQAGHDKHFVGDGYRSLLLSDAAFNYPFFKTTLWAFNGKLMYTAIYNSLVNLERTPNPTTPEANFRNKLGSFHYAAYRFNKYVTLGLFQGIIWQRMDSTGTLPFNFNYVNPLIFVNAAQYGFDNKNNLLMGSTAKINLPLKITLYGQVALTGTNFQTAWQAGIKYSGIKNLFLLAEYNSSASNTYKSRTAFQHYSHYYEPLAHPYGNDFSELVFMVQYNFKRIFVDSKFIYAIRDFNYNNFYNKDYEHFYNTYLRSEFYSLQSTLGFMLNRRNNLHIYVNYTHRYYIGEEPINWADTLYKASGIFTSTYSTIFSFGIKTHLFNTYYDF
jgi:hypothetical protein